MVEWIVCNIRYPGFIIFCQWIRWTIHCSSSRIWINYCYDWWILWLFDCKIFRMVWCYSKLYSGCFKLTDFLKEIIDKARPVITLSGQIAIRNINETPAFPSGHATKSMALALPFLLFASQKNSITIIVKILVFTTALLVWYSRIALQAHFLSDVLAGIGTALFFPPFSILFVNFSFIRKKVNVDKVNLPLIQAGSYQSADG